MGKLLSKHLIFPLTAVVAMTAACTGMRLRTPTAEEKRQYLFTKNIDRAMIDANEQGPLSILPYLSGAQGVPDSPVALWNQQKELVKGDIILAGYDDSDDDGLSELSGEDKGTSVLVATLIVLGVIIAVAVPVLYALHVF